MYSGGPLANGDVAPLSAELCQRKQKMLKYNIFNMKNYKIFDLVSPNDQNRLICLKNIFPPMTRTMQFYRVYIFSSNRVY